MTRITLVLKFLGLSAFWGLILGAATGLVAGFVLSPGLYGAALGLIGGGFAGTLLGGVTGIVLGVVTVFFYDSRDIRHYRVALCACAASVTLLGSLFLLSNIMKVYSVTGTVSPFVIIPLVIIAAFGAGYASQRIAEWYVRTVTVQI